jgi:hypothetical protein
MIIQTPAILKNHRSLADRSIMLNFLTQDVSLYGESISALLASIGEYGYLAFKTGEEKVLDGEIDFKVVKPIRGGSPSKDLRSAIFILWEKRGSEGEFDNFYAGIIEKFRQQVLAAVDKLN